MTKRRPPETHPVAWKSPLWNHLEEMRSMRRARKSWQEIADHLEKTHGLKVTHRTLFRFFARATKPKRVPLGFKDPRNGGNALPPAKPSPHPTPAAPPEQSPAPRASSAREEYARTQAEFMKQKAQQKQNEQKPYIYDPNED